MKKRRYHLTREQARVILLALKCYIEDLTEIIKKGSDNTQIGFLKFNRNQAEQVQQELENYQWEVE